MLQSYKEVFEVIEKFLEKLLHVVYLWILLHTAYSTFHDTKGGGFLKGALFICSSIPPMYQHSTWLTHHPSFHHLHHHTFTGHVLIQTKILPSLTTFY